MKREISKMAGCNFFKTFIGLICLVLTGSSPTEGMRLGSVLGNKIKEQRKVLSDLKEQIDKINIKIKEEKDRELSIREEKKQKTSDNDVLIDLKESAAKNLKKKLQQLEMQIHDKRTLLDGTNNTIKALDEEISKLDEQKQELENNIFLKKFDPDAATNSVTILGDDGVQTIPFINSSPNPKDPYKEKLEDFREKVTLPYFGIVTPILESQEKLARAHSLLLENKDLRNRMFMLENGISEDDFGSL